MNINGIRSTTDSSDPQRHLDPARLEIHPITNVYFHYVPSSGGSGDLGVIAINWIKTSSNSGSTAERAATGNLVFLGGARKTGGMLSCFS